MRLFTSIWFGVILLALILIYSSIISAYAPARWTLEMTEMQAFRHWLFVVLVVLFMVSLLATTALRTRWNAVNGGSLAAHVGLLLLGGGALLYFGTKIEGDLLLQSPRVELRMRAGDQTVPIARFPAAVDQGWARRLPPTDQPLSVQVTETRRDGAALSGVVLNVTQGNDKARVVDLRADRDAWQPIAQNVEARVLAFEPQTHFHDDETPALYIRETGSSERAEIPVHRLPIYHDHYEATHGVLVDSHGVPSPPGRPRPELKLFGLSIPTGWFERWEMPNPVDTGDLPFDLTITGYAAYVVGIQPRETADGQRVSQPVVAVREERRPGIAARALSSIRLRIEGKGDLAGWSDTQWCLFSMYPDVDARPLRIAPPDGSRAWEIVYSRQRHSLGARVAARELSVTYFPGRRGIESYRSEIVVARSGQEPLSTIVETNQICRVGPWTLYQSGFAGDQWSYSILGVGNRNGMWVMNVGWVTITLGCLYAFYIKPVILRRRARRARVGPAPAVAAGPPSQPEEATEPVAARATND